MAYGFQVKDGSNNLILDSTKNPPNNVLDIRKIGATETTSFNVTDYNDTNSWYITLPMPLSGQSYMEAVNYSDIPTAVFYGRPVESHTTGTNSFAYTGLNYGTSSTTKLDGLFIAGKYRGNFANESASGYGAYFRNNTGDTLINADKAPFFAIASGTTSVNSNANMDSARNSALSGTKCYKFNYSSSFSDSLNPCENRVQQNATGDNYIDGNRCGYYSCNSRHDFVYNSTGYTLADGRAVFPLVFIKIPNNVYISNLVFYRPTTLSQTCVSFWAMTTTGYSFAPSVSQVGSANILQRGRFTNPMGVTGYYSLNRNLQSDFNLPNPQNNYTTGIDIMVCYAGDAPSSSSNHGIEFYDSDGNVIFNSDMTCPTVENFSSQVYNDYENTPFFTTGGFGIYTNYADNGYGFSLTMDNGDNWVCINALATGSRAGASETGYEWSGSNMTRTGRVDMYATDYITRSGTTLSYGTGLIIGGAMRPSGNNYRGVYQMGRKFLMEASTP